MSDILIAVKDLSDFQMLSAALSDSVVFTDSWQNAIKTIAEQNLRVLVVDENFIGGPATELIERAMASCNHCTSVLLLTSDNTDLIINATNAGARFLIEQPVDMGQLLTIIRQGLASGNLGYKADSLIEAAIHDLNNARITFSFCSAITELDDETDPAPDRFLNQLQEAEDKIGGIVSYLKAFIRERETKLQVINLEAFIRSIEPKLHVLMDFYVHIESGSGAIQVSADPTQLQLLIFTLLDSAQIGSQNGDRLELRVFNNASCDLMTQSALLLEVSASTDSSGSCFSEAPASPEISALVEHMGGVFQELVDEGQAPTLRAYLPVVS